MRLTLTQPLPGTVLDPRYPDTDSKPMSETDFHTLALGLLHDGLTDFFASRRDVYVGRNLLLYYQQGNPRGCRDPDILVAKGVGKHRRRSFRIWEEKTLPRVLFEVVSKRTVHIDLGEKRLAYERLRIPEYLLFDPEGKYMDRPLRGFRLRKGVYVELTPAADGSLTSKELGLRLVPEGEMLRLIDVKTGKPVLTRQEQTEQANQRALAQKRRTQVAKQRAEAATQRAEAETRRAEAERQQALVASQQAEEARRRAAELAAEVERLRSRLNELQSPDA
jgi:Uma2 family endonuclease